MGLPRRAVPVIVAALEAEGVADGCDGSHPPVPGERPTMALGAEELFVVAALRTWVAALRAPDAPHPDWRGIMRLGGVSGPTALAFDGLMSTIARGAKRGLDVRCPACTSLGADEEAMLALVVCLQGRDPVAALDLLADWLPGEAAGAALRHARDFADGCEAVGLSLPPLPVRPRGATLH